MNRLNDQEFEDQFISFWDRMSNDQEPFMKFILNCVKNMKIDSSATPEENCQVKFMQGAMFAWEILRRETEAKELEEQFG